MITYEYIIGMSSMAFPGNYNKLGSDGSAHSPRKGGTAPRQ